jgi:hypothetical protein
MVNLCNKRPVMIEAVLRRDQSAIHCAIHSRNEFTPTKIRVIEFRYSHANYLTPAMTPPAISKTLT